MTIELTVFLLFVMSNSQSDFPLRQWISKTAAQMVEGGDNEAISDYVSALAKQIKPGDKNSKGECVSQLREIFDSKTESFVDQMFDQLENSYNAIPTSYESSKRKRNGSRDRSPSPYHYSKRSRRHHDDEHRLTTVNIEDVNTAVVAAVAAT